MSAPFSGPAAQLGQQYRKGAKLAFAEYNKEFTPKINLISADDGYDPIRTVENTRRFLLNPDIFALFGYVGTPTSAAILPLLETYKIPYIAPYTGAEILRSPTDDFITNFRASYYQEAETQISYFVDNLSLKRISLLIQADEFGASVAEGFRLALERRQMQATTIARYRRNSSDIQHAIEQITYDKAELVIVVGTYSAIAEIINTALVVNFQPKFSTVSFAGIHELAKLLPKATNIYASMVVANPFDSSIDIISQYQTQMRKTSQDEFDDVSLEGYIAAKYVTQAITYCKLTLTQQCVTNQLKGKNFAHSATIDIPPVYLIKLEMGKIVPLM